MLQLEELLRTIDLLKEANVAIPNDIHDKIQKYEIQMLQDELGALLNKFLFHKLQTFVRHEYSIIIDYTPDSTPSIKISPKTSKTFEYVAAEVLPVIETFKDETKSVQSDDTEQEEKIKESKTTTPTRTNIIKTDIKNFDDALDIRNSLKITFPNGDILHYKNKRKLLVEFARYVGVEKLHENDKDLVPTSIHYYRIDDSRIAANYENVTPNYWINTNYPLQDLLKLLSELNNKLRLGAFIEIVNYYKDESFSKIEPKRNVRIEEPTNECDSTSKNIKSEPVIHSTIEKKEREDSVENTEKDSTIEKKNCTVANPLPIKKPIKPFFNVHFEEEDAQVIPTTKKRAKSDSSIDIESQISQINSIALNGGHKIPHKAIYILTLIKGIREGFINPNEIYLDDRLITTFNLLWNKYVPAYSPFVSGVANPFMLLSTENFYHLKLLKPTNIKGKNWTIDSVREVCEFAYVSEEFIDYISREENRKRILEILTNNFKLNISSESEEKNQEIPVIEEAQIEEEENVVKAKIPSLPKPKFLNRSGATLFRLSYPNGIIGESDDFLNIYINFIKYAGPEYVEKLNIYSLGVNLIVRKDEIPAKYKSGFKDVGNGYFFNTISTTHRKYEVMSFISEELNLGVKIELVEKLHTTTLNVKEVSISKDVEPTQSSQTESQSENEPQIPITDNQEKKINSNFSIKDISASQNIISKTKTLTIEEPEINIVKEENFVKAEVPTLPKPEFLNQRGSTLLRLTYPNGYIEESDTYTDIFTEFVKYAGSKRVRELNIYSLGVNLIVRKDEIPAKYKSGFKDVGNGYFLNTVSATQRKYEVMSFISEVLNLGVKIELVAREYSAKPKVQKPTRHIVYKEIKPTQGIINKEIKPTLSPVQKQQNDTDLQSSIIDYITRFPNSKALNIADYLKVDRKEVNSILYRLQKEGRCEINPWFQWSIAVISSPASSVKAPSHVYGRKNSVPKDIDTLAYNRIFSMRCSNRDGYKAPHKAIYLLSIIDCVELGEIKNRRFNITSLLLKRFEENWDKYVHLECFSPTIWNPIFYIEDNIIHREWNPVFEGTKPNSLEHCGLIFEYLEIASDLWRAVQNKSTLQRIKERIVEAYITNNTIQKS